MAGRRIPAGNAAPDDIAGAWRSIELLRLETRNAAGYLETATNPWAPPRADAITAATRAERETVASTGVLSAPAGRSLPPPVATILDNVRARRAGVKAADPSADAAAAGRVGRLLAATEAAAQLDAVGAAFRATGRGTDGGVPPAAVPRAKRRAADRLDRLVGSQALQRDPGALAERWLTRGDGIETEEARAPIPWAYITYRAAGRLAEGAMCRGQRLGVALGADGAAGD